ncbi:AMID-like mitochondrial oxidoreductase-like protein [Plenodomus tracheiphilus IPT5]|uniref:AMID-like mitochondrial oxidoreductase-like protein n=1 Tax=Plenodomus tracheiphilus IPT5 TaxID=1408161 RepID=A0A6A7BBF3_9PLEO|nr:AMID-like mitochondrial oxidoreductase-like protein [Plenodomus tracheiphilus IPT5]
MAEERNIVVVGGSSAGLSAAHYTLKHILPALKAKKDAKYHVYLIAPSAHWYFRVASPRVAASTKRMAVEKIVFDLNKGFAKYPKEDFTLIEASATGLDTASRTLNYRSDAVSENQCLAYHALIVATGSKTYHPAFSANTNIQDTLDAVKETNEKIAASKKIVIVGGGPTGVEFAGEVAEHRNGKPGWFSKASKSAEITLISADAHLLTTLRPAISKLAETKLKALNVDVLYNTRVLDTTPSKDGTSTTLSLSNGTTLETDYFVPAYGVEPNSDWLPPTLLDEKRYLKSNHNTLRVDEAGPRVYAFGDIGSHSNNTAYQINLSLPALAVNLTRDLLSYDAADPEAKPKGKDRHFVVDTREGAIVPIGSGGGVGALMGYKVPSFFVWLLKGRDYMLGLSAPTVSGGNVAKAVKLEKGEEFA